MSPKLREQTNRNTKWSYEGGRNLKDGSGEDTALWRTARYACVGMRGMICSIEEFVAEAQKSCAVAYARFIQLLKKSYVCSSI